MLSRSVKKLKNHRDKGYFEKTDRMLLQNRKKSARARARRRIGDIWRGARCILGRWAGLSCPWRQQEADNVQTEVVCSGQAVTKATTIRSRGGFAPAPLRILICFWKAAAGLPATVNRPRTKRGSAGIWPLKEEFDKLKKCDIIN